MLERRAARRSFTEFCRRAGFVPAKHHAVLIDRLERLARGEIRKLMVFMPPGSAKSTYTSVLFPAWWLAQGAKGNIIAASHSTELAERFGRKVRGLVSEHGLLLGYGLSASSSSAGRWETTTGREYYAAGVGVGIAGFRSALSLIDDPFRSRMDADSKLIRDRVWDWYNDDLDTRLVPGGAQALVMCMVGDTRVLMADGSEKALKSIRPGDMVATYDEGRVSSSLVKSWKNQGPDIVFEIRMKSGITVKANEKHPFLVDCDGTLEWIRLRNLKPGDKILRAAPIGANGEVSSVQATDATSRPSARGSAIRIITRRSGQAAIAPLRSIRPLGGQPASSIAIRSLPANTTRSSPHRVESALSASDRPARMSDPIGAANSASITTIERERSAACSATIATLRSDTERQRTFSSGPLDTFGITPDAIVGIVPAGREDVFDIEVERTANFIANGLVSHNTRWHEDDLAGRLLARDGDAWDVLSIPAIAGDDDPLGRRPGEWLWEDEYGYADRLREKRATTDPRSWSALYQQQPTPDTGDYFRREWLVPTPIRPDPKSLRIYGGSDYAVTAGGGDYTVHAVVGLDSDDRMYLLDLWRGQADSAEWIAAWCDLVKKWRPIEWAEETGQIKASVGPFLEREALARKAYVARRQFPTRGDKAVRAQSIRGRMAMRGLYVPDNAPWRSDFEAELLRFPAGVHDDQVDALGLVGQLLDTMHAPAPPKAPEPSKATGYRPASKPRPSWRTV